MSVPVAQAFERGPARPVLVVGEINVDLVLQGYREFPAPGREVLVDDFVMTLGSASAIAAVGLAKLGSPVAMCSRVGRDRWGDYCLETLAAAGVDLHMVERRADVKTGVTVSISSVDDRALVTFPGSIVAMTPDAVASLSLEGFGHLHVSSYFLQAPLRPALPALFRRATAAGLTTSLDPGFDPEQAWDLDPGDVLAHVDVFLPNRVELRALTREPSIERSLRALRNGRTRTVAKLGGDGCAALEDDVLVRVPAPPADVVDTTGAGDSFNAGFLDQWLRRAPLRRCLHVAAWCGAMSTRGIGGVAAQASAAERDVCVATLAAPSPSRRAGSG